MFLNLRNNLIIFFTGGFVYCTLELLFRGFSHISMFIVGGIIFVFIRELNQKQLFEDNIFIKMLVVTLFITMIELIAGLIVNVWLDLQVWDYSDVPFNFMGQICILFSNIWFFLSYIAIYFTKGLERIMSYCS